jgi:hypothetical protein
MSSFLYSLFLMLPSRVIPKECRVHMGRDLVLEFPPFLENIRSMDRVLKTLEHAPSWSIEGKLTHIKPLPKVNQTDRNNRHSLSHR